MKKIVIVEDELFMREELVSILQKEAYVTCCITSFINTAEEILKASPDLVLLDLNLPGVTGFEICKTIRMKSTAPILVLTSRDQLRDELHALGLGADEYLTKPCNKDRLIARISNLLRRYEDRNHFIEIKGVKLDLQTYTMYANEQSIVLTENQGKIMELLLLNAGKIVTKDMLFEKIWGTKEYIDENALQVNMTRLKKTIRSLNIKYEIITVRGKGYNLVAIEEKEND
ncbi:MULTISPECIES: response regulator transcription factor [unclassified Clostridium]|uniref:response regulator transcription factor n=1 Tax=unclassified Clostridium TaxID=2614128 RepID=UPI0013F00B9C|nr:MULTISPECIES: response regulator transcription factor [unclassified Clostridium]NFG62637.1 response regulator transcription factor [Clostridium botulinum]NFQ10001.1 response regulator transcription factor [Clostridium botulinum]